MRPDVELEDNWRSRVSAAASSYKLAVADCTRVFQEHRATTPDGSYAIRQALKRESSARREYMRVLRIFRDLTLRGKVPPEES